MVGESTDMQQVNIIMNEEAPEKFENDEYENDKAGRKAGCLSVRGAGEV